MSTVARRRLIWIVNAPKRSVPAETDRVSRDEFLEDAHHKENGRDHTLCRSNLTQVCAQCDKQGDGKQPVDAQKLARYEKSTDAGQCVDVH